MRDAVVMLPARGTAARVEKAASLPLSNSCRGLCQQQMRCVRTCGIWPVPWLTVAAAILVPSLKRRQYRFSISANLCYVHRTRTPNKLSRHRNASWLHCDEWQCLFIVILGTISACAIFFVTVVIFRLHRLQAIARIFCARNLVLNWVQVHWSTCLALLHDTAGKINSPRSLHSIHTQTLASKHAFCNR
jgi:hypothetical protein